MTEPRLLERGFRSHPRNTKHFPVPLPFDKIKEQGSTGLGLKSTGCLWRAWHMDWSGEAVTDWRPWRCSIMGLDGDAQAQAHPGSTCGKLSAQLPWAWHCHNQCLGNRDLLWAAAHRHPAQPVQLKRPADKTPYNTNHGSEQTKGKWWILGDASWFLSVSCCVNSKSFFQD